MFAFVCHIIRHVVEILCTLCWIFFKCGIALFIGRGEYCFPHMLSLFVPQAWFSCVLITKDAICNAYWGDKGKRGTTKIKVQASLPFQNKVPLLILTSLKEGIGLQHGDAEFWHFVIENNLERGDGDWWRASSHLHIYTHLFLLSSCRVRRSTSTLLCALSCNG